MFTVRLYNCPSFLQFSRPELEMVSHYEDSGHSLLNVLEKFIHAADQMDSTILVPSKLMDVPITDITNPSSDAFLQNNMDLRGFYSMVKATRTELCQGSKFVGENETYLCPMQHELREIFNRIKQYTLVAKYIKTSASILVQTSCLQPFSEFESKSSHRPLVVECIIAALKDFIHEVTEMEKAVLFPSLLRNCSADDLMHFCKFPMVDEPENLFEVFDLLKLLKNRLLGNPQDYRHVDPKLQQKIVKLFQTFLRYTVMTQKLTARYKQELECF